MNADNKTSKMFNWILRGFKLSMSLILTWIMSVVNIPIVATTQINIGFLILGEVLGFYVGISFLFRWVNKKRVFNPNLKFF